MDKALLQQHALPLLATYKYSEPYMLRALRMDEHLPFPGRGFARPPLDVSHMAGARSVQLDRTRRH